MFPLLVSKIPIAGPYPELGPLLPWVPSGLQQLLLKTEQTEEQRSISFDPFSVSFHQSGPRPRLVIDDPELLSHSLDVFVENYDRQTPFRIVQRPGE
jgi:hypothetical protein